MRNGRTRVVRPIGYQRLSGGEGEYLVLRQGDQVEFEFPPEVADADEVKRELVVGGYYIPERLVRTEVR
jgi:hypothetical protein